jgi:hypothetical protein
MWVAVSNGLSDEAALLTAGRLRFKDGASPRFASLRRSVIAEAQGVAGTE